MEIFIYRYGDVIAGYYENDGGEVLGKMVDDHTMVGQWVENGSGKTCDSEIYGKKTGVLWFLSSMKILPNLKEIGVIVKLMLQEQVGMPRECDI